MNGTQIIATIGPPTLKRIGELRAAGMDGLRINSSHGTADQHREIIRSARKLKNRPFMVYDIKGPKIRLGDIPEALRLKTGQKIVLRTGMKENNGWPFSEDFSDGIPVAFSSFHKYVKKGDRLLVDDGLIGMRVENVRGRRIFCEVLYGGILRSRKGINHPDTVIDFPYTVDVDIPLIDFAVRHGVDYIADSFVRDADDVSELRGRLKGTGVKIISKIENPEGVKNFDAILRKTDAVMIARGDLGVELDPWEIPELQKVMIEKCNRAGKPVITATQMLESMIDDPRPSRSDVSDIANAIYDGTDAVMLSGETSAGKYPALCVEMMRKIIKKTESTARFKKLKKKYSRL